MDQGKRLLPMRWPAAWTEPSRLSALEGEAVNCLLFDDPAACASVRQAALRRGFAVEQPETIVRIAEGVWPGLVRQERQRGAEAAPTGNPWVDSNGWRVRLEQCRAPGKPVWVDAALPKDLPPMLRPAHLTLAVADAAAYGATWVIPPWEGMDLASPLCRELLQTIKFFEARAEWRSFSPWARLGIVSDFAGDNEFMGGEVLNLATRRGLAYRALLPAAVNAANLHGLHGLLHLDAKPPAGPALAAVRAFVEAGGLLIAPAEIARLFHAGAALADPPHGYRVRRVAKGRLAEPVEPWGDPYIVAADAHTLLSRRNDYATIYNASSVVPYIQRSPDGKRTLIHLPNYALRANPGQPMSIRLPGTVKRVRWYVAPVDEARELPLTPTEGYQELQLPDTPVYSALEID